MLRRTFRPAALALLGLLTVPVPAALAAASALPPPRVVPRTAPKVEITDYRLPNGLRVILAPDYVAPVVSLTVMYDVGSRNERPGLTGFAHLFEHMMFQGSENVGKGEHFALISENGGSFNGTTSQDRTVYYATVPANQLELLLFLEADRMRTLEITQENLDNQREVVKEERRQRVDNQPYGSLYEVSLQTFFHSFAYQHSTIGSMDDLNSATVQDARDFFRTHYAPNNAVIVVVGDFDIAEAKAGIERYFTNIPRQPAPPTVNPEEPRYTGERRETITDPHATMPRFRRYYRTVRGDHPDFYALQVLATILSGRGKTGRLYDPVVESKLALGVGAVQLEMRTNSPFQIDASLPVKADIEKVEETIERELERVKEEGVTEEEMERARIQLKTSATARLQEAGPKGLFMASYTLYYSDPDRINTLYSRQASVTPADVQRVARTYLRDDNSATIIVLPGKQTAGAGGENEATGAAEEENA